MVPVKQVLLLRYRSVLILQLVTARYWIRNTVVFSCAIVGGVWWMVARLSIVKSRQQ